MQQRPSNERQPEYKHQRTCSNSKTTAYYTWNHFDAVDDVFYLQVRLKTVLVLLVYELD